jgi:hypothetical protein
LLDDKLDPIFKGGDMAISDREADHLAHEMIAKHGADAVRLAAHFRRHSKVLDERLHGCGDFRRLCGRK